MVKSKLCIYENCTNCSNFGFKGFLLQYCFYHKQENMVKKSILCIYENCNKCSNFALKDCKSQYCFNHKKENMINVNCKTCMCCKKRANYALKDQKALYCVNHKLENMIDVNNKRCFDENCDKLSTFGLKGCKALYCDDHKLENMINVKKKTCIEEMCEKSSIFALKGHKAIYCFDHKTENMIDVKNKKCIVCGKQSIFGLKNRKAEFCKDHKEENMIDVKNKTCCRECGSRPTFGLKNGKAEYCLNHKKENMINVVSKLCHCGTHSSYGTNITGRVHCKKHANVKIEWKLTYCKCRSIAIRSEDGNYPYEYCDNCAPINYKSQLAGTCINCNLTNMILDVDNKCLLSCTIKHKDRMKYSENELFNFLTTKKLKFIYNQKVENSCSNRIPDFIIDITYGILIIENDENQHKARTCECEQTRMIGIYNDYGSKPVHFIRFNPDKYLNNTNKSLSVRHNFLYKQIKYIENNSLEFFTRNNTLSVSYLYYDNFNDVFEVNKIDYDNNLII